MVISAAIRAELSAHAAEDAPNECCGLVVLRDGAAERYIRGRNKLASPYRYELEIDREPELRLCRATVHWEACERFRPHPDGTGQLPLLLIGPVDELLDHVTSTSAVATADLLCERLLVPGVRRPFRRKSEVEDER